VRSQGKPVSAPGFWEALYAQGQDGWELREPAPLLRAWLLAGGCFEPGPGRARVGVPGAGRGHDARLLARHGYRAGGEAGQWPRWPPAAGRSGAAWPRSRA
jgi:hypothetical protein